VQPLELWAGFECTLNRVGDRYHDQFGLSGHRDRLGDLDLLADLGIRTVRYPVLWERAPDWEWTDARLTRLRELGIRPIVGLVHHGSGPPATSLLCDRFAPGLAEHAAAVAERYDWVEDWTPVNEPLTTARFSALYGHWYPHARDGRLFARALLNQCRATVLSMAAIRARIPAARLVQTEDVGYVHATAAPLADQAAFENDRRWATFDLLTGRLDRNGRFGRWLRAIGVPDDELGWFREHACPPDVVGLNHYLSSERLLDHRLERYDTCWHGGNGRERYADVHAPASFRRGPESLLQEAWRRYQLPLAITEAHNAIHREEQLRWLIELWRAARAVRANGGDVRAVTVWSLLGTFGWDTLCTGGSQYEAGVYDVRGGTRRPTALARAARDLAAGRVPSHPVLADRGWWRADRRPLRGRPLLVTGGTGTLGRAFAAAAAQRNLAHRLLTRAELDIADRDSVAAALDEIRPWAVVNAAGYVRVDDAERELVRCLRENADGPARLAAACTTRGLPLVTFSSDLVFDGRAGRPYVESDPPSPLNAYGYSKARAEERVLSSGARALVVRTSAFFGPSDPYNFAAAAVHAVRTERRFVADAETTVSPTYVPDLVHATLDLLVDGEIGLWHLANRGAVTWFEFARHAAAAAGADERLVEPAPALTLPAPRPRYSVLGSERALLLPPLDEALERFGAAVAA